MIIFISWIILAILVGVYAGNKGRSGAGFFFLSIFLSPLIGFIVALVVKPNVAKVEKAAIQQGESKKCPYCAELIKVEAIVCRYCSKEVESKESIDKPEVNEIEPEVNDIGHYYKFNPDNRIECSKCGSIVKMSDKKCHKCGLKF